MVCDVCACVRVCVRVCNVCVMGVCNVYVYVHECVFAYLSLQPLVP